MFSLASVSNSFSQTKPLIIVTDIWPPYVIEEENKVSGTDVDITHAVFKKMGIPIDIKILPWKRCVELVKQNKVDGILDISLTEERKTFLHYPNSPISTGTTVFFKRSKDNITFTNLSDLNRKRTGAILGYNYCQELDSQEFIINAERVSNLDQNFHKLLAGRIDLLVEVDSVGLFTAKKLGLSSYISIIPNAKYCIGGNYLAFSKNAKNKELSLLFNNALEAYKASGEYSNLLDHYGLKY